MVNEGLCLERQYLGGVFNEFDRYLKEECSNQKEQQVQKSPQAKSNVACSKNSKEAECDVSRVDSRK